MKMENEPGRRYDWLTKLLIWIASADEETLRISPPGDLTHVKATAILLILSMIYQAAVFSLASHSLFAAPGKIRPDLIAVSLFVAWFIMMIDSVCVVGSQWYAHGVEIIRKAGLDISGGIGARAKATSYLCVRLIFALAICMLCGICSGLVVFRDDVDAFIDQQSQRINAQLVAPATAWADAAIKRALADVEAQNKVVASLTSQVEALRQDEIDPFASDPRVQQAQTELTQLLQEKTKADGDVQAAESFAAQELAGAKGPGHTGIVGSGPKRRAALEQVAAAKSHTRQVDADLVTARDRLDTAHKEATAESNTVKPAPDKLAEFAATLKVETKTLAAAKEQLRRLTAGREDAIRAAIERSPGYVAPSRGFLARIDALEHIAGADPKIAAVIVLIDLSSFGLELASILSKVANLTPTTYSALIARDAYIRALHIADEISREIDISTMAFAAEAGRLNPRPAGPCEGFGLTPDDDTDDHPPGPPKRPRGRPRKNPPEDQ